MLLPSQKTRPQDTMTDCRLEGLYEAFLKLIKIKLRLQSLA